MNRPTEACLQLGGCLKSHSWDLKCLRLHSLGTALPYSNKRETDCDEVCWVNLVLSSSCQVSLCPDPGNRYFGSPGHRLHHVFGLEVGYCQCHHSKRFQTAHHNQHCLKQHVVLTRWLMCDNGCKKSRLSKFTSAAFESSVTISPDIITSPAQLKASRKTSVSFS